MNRLPLILLTTAALGACASVPPEQAAKAPTEERTDCVKTTGSNICRDGRKGDSNVVWSISGDDLRRSGAPITGATPGRAE
jgi:hypothetical protein